MTDLMRDIEGIIADDALAMTYQTMGQYRTGLLKIIRQSLARQPQERGEAVADTRWQPVGPEARRCRECNAPRKGDTCWKCGSETFKPHHSWVEAELPDVARIRALAKEVGYAIGEHGSKERDFDIIAAPWAEDAVGFDELVAHIAAGINAHEVGDRERKPHGRVGVNLQIDGYYKLIDLSVMPLATPAAAATDVAGEQAKPVGVGDMVRFKAGYLASQFDASVSTNHAELAAMMAGGAARVTMLLGRSVYIGEHPFRLALNPEWLEVVPAHPTPDSGRVAELEAQLAESAKCAFEYAAKVGELERQLAASREREGRMRAFIEEVSKQTPEKPDYWSSCGQCSHNQSDAEDIIDALAADKEQTK